MPKNLFGRFICDGNKLSIMEWNKKEGMEWIYACHTLVWEFDGEREERFSTFVFGVQ